MHAGGQRFDPAILHQARICKSIEVDLRMRAREKSNINSLSERVYIWLFDGQSYLTTQCRISLKSCLIGCVAFNKEVRRLRIISYKERTVDA